ncbi:MAG: hypothetical protein H7145_24670, partial [Akkermansiaceae bacterium]|nr:hypothetical protein [Armatimonadota bacterium]
MPLRRAPILLLTLLVCLAFLPQADFSPVFLAPRAAHAQASATTKSDASPPQSPSGPAKKDGEEKDSKKTSPFTLVMGLIAGLALFLFGVEQMARGFQAVAGDNIKAWLERFTKNRFAAVGTGAVATTLLDSSSV